MLKQLERKSAHLKYGVPVALFLGCAMVSGFYLAGRDADPPGAPPTTSLLDDAENSTASQAENPPDLFASLVESGARQIESGGRAEQSSRAMSKKGHSTDDHVVDGQSDVPGFSAEEVKLLHARQLRDVEQTLGDLDAIVIENADGRGITVRELRSMHERQESNSESVFEGEVVISSGADTSAALTVADLRRIHKEQGKEVGATDFRDEIVISRSVDGIGDLTGTDIEALHEREHLTSQSDTRSTNDYPAPVPEGGSSYLTVDELRELHKSQSQK